MFYSFHPLVWMADLDCSSVFDKSNVTLFIILLIDSTLQSISGYDYRTCSVTVQIYGSTEQGEL